MIVKVIAKRDFEFNIRNLPNLAFYKGKAYYISIYKSSNEVYLGHGKFIDINDAKEMFLFL